MKELEMKSITYNDITYNRYRVVEWSRLQIAVGQYLYQVKLEATEDEEEVTPAEKSNQNMPNQSTPNSHCTTLHIFRPPINSICTFHISTSVILHDFFLNLDELT